MKKIVFLLFICAFISSPSFAKGEEKKGDPKLYQALEAVFRSSGISFKTCFQNIQILIRSAIKKRVDLTDAEVLVFGANDDFLRPKSLRWSQVPYYSYHVVLVKDGYVFDYAAMGADQKPIVYELQHYFKTLFPSNDLSQIHLRVIPASKMLTAAHKKLRMDDSDSYRYIRRVWAESRSVYEEVRYAGPTTTLEQYNNRQSALYCSKVFSP